MSSYGSITITQNVIKDIVIESLKHIEHVIGISNLSSKKEVMNFFKNNTETKLFEVELGESECVIDLPVVLEYGYNIIDISENIQKTVTESVERLTKVKVREINIIIEKVEVSENKLQEEVVL